MAEESSEQRQVEVLLEEVRHELRVVAEGHSTLDRKIERVDTKIDRVAQELSSKMDMGFSTVMKELQKVGQRAQEHERAHTA